MRRLDARVELEREHDTFISVPHYDWTEVGHLRIDYYYNCKTNTTLINNSPESNVGHPLEVRHLEVSPVIENRS